MGGRDIIPLVIKTADVIIKRLLIKSPISEAGGGFFHESMHKASIFFQSLGGGRATDPNREEALASYQPYSKCEWG